jgi:hypothetical protein
MGNGLGIVGFVCVIKAARLSRLGVMSSCLDESRSCTGVDPGGRLMSEVESIACHLVAMGVARGSRVEELYERFFRCSGNSACRSLRK